MPIANNMVIFTDTPLVKKAREAESVIVCGRIVSIRDMGKTVFAHVEDGTGKIQLFLRRDEIGEERNSNMGE